MIHDVRPVSEGLFVAGCQYSKLVGECEKGQQAGGGTQKAREGEAAGSAAPGDANLARFPDGVWVRIKPGDGYRKFGDLATAETVYCYALALTDEFGASYDREGAVERLVNLLHETGRGAEKD